MVNGLLIPVAKINGEIAPPVGYELCSREKADIWTYSYYLWDDELPDSTLTLNGAVFARRVGLQGPPVNDEEEI